MKKPEAKNKATATQNEARQSTQQTDPSADKRKFVAQVEFDNKLNASAEKRFKDGPGSLQSVFGSEKSLLQNKKWRSTKSRRMEDLPASNELRRIDLTLAR